jgi:hypothetical protein
MKDYPRKVHFGEEGHFTEEGVALFVDALKLDRTEDLPEAMRAHLAECHECKVNVTDLYLLLEGEKIEEAHPTLAPRAEGHAMLYRAAAVVAISVGIAAVLYFTWPPSEPPVQSAVTSPLRRPDSTVPPAPRATPSHPGISEPIAANYSPLPELESLAGGNTRGEAFEDLSPDSWPRGGEITLRWKTSSPGPWTIVLVDNRGKTLNESKADREEISLPGRFRPGLYYWKVLRNEELIYVGKFRVER